MSKKTQKKAQVPKEKALKLNQEVFCQNYSGCSDRSFMSNGVLSYLNAFNIDTVTTKIRYKAIPKSSKNPNGRPSYWDYTPEYKVSKSQASILLTKPNIRLRIHQLFKILFSTDVVDNELLNAIMQMEDWKAKVQAIREYNELKGRITKKIKLSGGVKSNLNEKQMVMIAEQVLKKAKK